jgi:predicted CoA-binding protein
MGGTRQRVVVLGASEKPERHSNMAVRMLLEHGHEVVPVNPRADAIAGLSAVQDLSSVRGHVDTLSVYVSAAISASLRDKILALRPDRVIFNPGAENTELQEVLERQGLKTEQACTLVLLRTSQF